MINRMSRTTQCIATVLCILATALTTSAVFADDNVSLTQEQRKMQAYAVRQYDRGRMAAARGQVREAEGHFSEAVKTYEKHFGKNDERLIEPIVAHAQLYIGALQKPKKKQRTLLERLLDLYDSAGKSAQERATVMAQLGDWWVMSGKEAKSTAYYQQAWQTIADDDGPKEANLLFEKAHALYFEPPIYRPEYTTDPGNETIVTFTIAPSGRVVDLNVLESDAPTKLSTSLTKALRKRRYRPFLVDGVPQAATNINLSYTYPATGGFPAEAAVTTP